MKKNNLGVIICFIVVIILITVFAIIKLNSGSQKPDEGQEDFTQDQLKDMEYVDKKLEMLTKSDNYKHLSLDSRVMEVEKVLKELKKDKYIDYYSYDKNSYLFSFQYKSGALGGVMLKEFDSMLN